MSFAYIRKTENGYLVETESTNDKEFIVEYVISENHDFEEREAKLRAFQEMVWYLQEHFGLSYNRNEKLNLIIGIRNKEGDFVNGKNEQK